MEQGNGSGEELNPSEKANLRMLVLELSWLLLVLTCQHPHPSRQVLCLDSPQTPRGCVQY